MAELKKLKYETKPKILDFAKYIPENKLINVGEKMGLCNYNISKFIKDFDIDIKQTPKCIKSLNIDDCAQNFKTLNDFFTRDIINKYPITKYNLLSPAESYIIIFNKIKKAQKFWIKGTHFSIKNLLSFEPLNGIDYSIIINRLAPKHYHNFYAPTNGKVLNVKDIDGLHLSVNAEIIKKGGNALTKNARKVVTIDTTKFGIIYYIIIGATCVYDIDLKIKPGDKIKKGQNIGLFNYGGSTIVMLISNISQIKFNKFILENSATGFETEIPVRYPIGDI
jgi:phosphatidylserine decarboxylase